MRRVFLILALILTFALPAPTADAFCSALKSEELNLFAQQAEILRGQGMTENDVTGRLMFSGKTPRDTRLAIKAVHIVFRYGDDPAKKLMMLRQECDRMEVDD